MHARDRLYATSWIAVALVVGATAGAGGVYAATDAATSNKSSKSTSVQTTYGPVQGSLVNGVSEFKGIPYAAPPVGNLRWMPPQAPKTWTSVLKATAFGPQCLQVTTLGPFAGPANANEDCLYLNVYSPNVKASSTEKMPTIVWIHGGGNLDGGSDAYNGSKLAVNGKTVVVTINYRLGLLGFMANPAIDTEGHPFGNYGLLDQQAALKWVNQNIAAFGGDPQNVTLGGQSAGSVDTESNMISPLAKNMFQRAIFQSILLEPATLPVAEAKGTAFAQAAGCNAGYSKQVAACLRALTAQQIFQLSGTASTSAAYESNIIQDGTILPSKPFTTLIAQGQFNHMPVMSGEVEDESNFSLGITEYFSKPRAPATAADYQAKVQSYNNNPAYPANTGARITALYPLNAYASPQLALDAIGTDASACAQRHTNLLLASQVPVYMYEFDDRTAPSYFPKMPGFQPLAYHTSDIQYIFPGWHGGNLGIAHPLNDKQETLSDEMVQTWTNFARTGNPNGQGNQLWPRMDNRPDSSVPSVLSENIPVLSTFTNKQYDAAHKCNLWDAALTF